MEFSHLTWSLVIDTAPPSPSVRVVENTPCRQLASPSPQNQATSTISPSHPHPSAPSPMEALQEPQVDKSLRSEHFALRPSPSGDEPSPYPHDFVHPYTSGYANSADTVNSVLHKRKSLTTSKLFSNCRLSKYIEIHPPQFSPTSLILPLADAAGSRIHFPASSGLPPIYNIRASPRRRRKSCTRFCTLQTGLTDTQPNSDGRDTIQSFAPAQYPTAWRVHPSTPAQGRGHRESNEPRT